MSANSFLKLKFKDSNLHTYCKDCLYLLPKQKIHLLRSHNANFLAKSKKAWQNGFSKALRWNQIPVINKPLFCYDELHEDATGICTNKMLANKKLFERVATHPSFAQKNFILILNKFDLLEEKNRTSSPMQCDWFQDFSPLISLNPHNTTNPPLAQRAFHYIAVKFKRLFNSLTGRKLFVAPVTGLEADSVDLAFKYGREVLKWDMEKLTFSMNEDSIESIEASTT